MSLSIQNQEVEQQLRTQEQLQQLAAAVGSATAAASGAGRPAGAAGLRAPPLVSAVATSPPNSQRKLLMHLTVSARPADAEVCAWLWWVELGARGSRGEERRVQHRCAARHLVLSLHPLARLPGWLACSLGSPRACMSAAAIRYRRC